MPRSPPWALVRLVAVRALHQSFTSLTDEQNRRTTFAAHDLGAKRYAPTPVYRRCPHTIIPEHIDRTWIVGQAVSRDTERRKLSAPRRNSMAESTVKEPLPSYQTEAAVSLPLPALSVPPLYDPSPGRDHSHI